MIDRRHLIRSYLNIRGSQGTDGNTVAGHLDRCGEFRIIEDLKAFFHRCIRQGDRNGDIGNRNVRFGLGIRVDDKPRDESQ